MKDDASCTSCTSDLNISNHQHAFTHSTTRVSLLLRLPFLLPQLKTQVPPPPTQFSKYSFLTVISMVFYLGAPSSCTSGGCLASGNRVFQSLLSSIQHQVNSPSIHQSVSALFPTLFPFASWKPSPRTLALRVVGRRVEVSSASAHNAQPRYQR